MTDSNISPADLAPMWSKDPFYLSTMSMGYTRKAESIYKELEDPQVSMLRAEPDMKGQKIGTGPRREGTRSTRAMPWPTGTTVVTKPHQPKWPGGAYNQEARGHHYTKATNTTVEDGGGADSPTEACKCY